MTFYDSFARLGRDLVGMETTSTAWVWRHYTGLQYQSFAERVAATKPFVPMAWVWSSYRAGLPDRKIAEIASDDVATYEAVIIPVIYDEAPSKIDSNISEANYTISDLSHQIDKPLANFAKYEDNQATSGDIIKLLASLVFAASIIYGVHILRG